MQRSRWAVLLTLAAACTCGGTLLATRGGQSGSPQFGLGPADPSAVFALGRRPSRSLETVWAAPYVMTDRRLDGFSVTIAATFPSQARAEAVGHDLEGVLARSAAWLDVDAGDRQRSVYLAKDSITPPAPAEVTWLRSHGVARPRGGIGWAGPRHATAPSVQILGTTVIVTDLKHVEAYAGYETYPHPLATALEKAGARVLIEDRVVEKGIAAELTCEAPTARAKVLAEDLADYFALPNGFLSRPPWDATRLSEDQRRARRTCRLVVDHWANVSSRQLADRRVQELALRAASSSPAEGRKLFAELQRLMLEKDLDVPPLPASERLDPTVLAWFAADQARLAALDKKAAKDPQVLLQASSKEDERARAEREFRRGAHVGQLPHTRARNGLPIPTPADADAQIWVAQIGRTGGRLDIGSVIGQRFAVLFPTLARYLSDGGCTQLAYALADEDDVIAD